MALEAAAFAVFRKGHLPIVGLNLALPIIYQLEVPFWDQNADRDRQEAVDRLSLGAAQRCDAVVRIGGASEGADAEVEVIRARGGAVYWSVDEIPDERPSGSGAG